MPSSLASPHFFLFVVIAVAVEFAWRRCVQRRRYDAGEAAASFGVAIGQNLVKSLNALVTVPTYMAVHAAAPARLPMDDPFVWVAGFFAVEFAYYWMHRWSHTIRWMWASHSVHHSSETFALPAAVRLGWTGLISGAWLVFLPLVLVGFHPFMVIALLAANLKYQFLLHTEAVGRLGPLELVFNTPAHHRVHHASNPDYLDKNFGGVLIVFDRLFGTFAEERPDAPLRYGLTRPLRSNNPFVIAFSEWGAMVANLRAARSLGDVLSATLGRPNDAVTPATARTSLRLCPAAERTSRTA